MKTHRHCRFVLLFCLVFGICTAHAVAKGPHDLVRVGIFPAEPLNFIDNEGIAQGFYPDLLEEIVKDGRWRVEYVPGSWAEGLERLQNGEIDLMPSVGFSPARAEFMAFNNESVAELWGQVFVKPDGKSKNINDLEGSRVGVMRRDITGGNFKITAEKFGVRCEVIEFSTHAEVFAAVREGDVDAGIAPQHIGLRRAGEYNLVGSSIMFSPFSIFFASKKGTQHDFLDNIDTHLSRWKKDPHSFYYDRLNYWLGSQGHQTKVSVWLVYGAVIGAVTLVTFFCFTLLLKRKVRRRTEELRESETTFRKLFEDSSNAILLIDGRGLFVECNQSALDLLKMTRKQFLLLSPADISPDFQADGRRSAEAAQEMIDQAYSKGLHRFDWTCVNAEDGEFIVEVSLMPIMIKGQTMLHTTWQDITDRRQAEEELRKSEEKFRHILTTVREGILSLDADWHITFANAHLAKMFGYELEELIGQSFEIFLHEDDLADFAREKNQREQGQFSHFERRFRTRDGSEIWTIVSASAFTDSEGCFAGSFGTITDITARKQAEEEKEKLQMQLTQAQKMESVGRLAGGVAHDFNNMLGVILGYAELAQNQLDKTNPLYNNLEEIRKAAKRSADLTRQLLTFARKQTVVPKVVDLNQIVAGMLNMLRRLIGEDINLIWIPGTGLWPIKMDPSQIDQILANLCVNARDAIVGIGNISVATENSVIDRKDCAALPGFVPGEYVRIAVSDSGKGMGKETLGRIFEPFFTTKGLGEGTGLGLASVYGAVKQNNGFIDARSEPDKGATFTIYLPRHMDSTCDMSSEEATEEKTGGHETVLLVEDEQTILTMTTTMLQKLGYTVLPASTPREAIRLAEEFNNEIHLLLTDVVMPEMNGRDLGQRLLSLYPHLTTLFMSGYTSDIIAQQSVLNEGVEFIQKPFSQNDLAAKLRELLN